jgi:hypothetical protein
MTWHPRLGMADFVVPGTDKLIRSNDEKLEILWYARAPARMQHMPIATNPEFAHLPEGVMHADIEAIIRSLIPWMQEEEAYLRKRSRSYTRMQKSELFHDSVKLANEVHAVLPQTRLAIVNWRIEMGRARQKTAKLSRLLDLANQDLLSLVEEYVHQCVHNKMRMRRPLKPKEGSKRSMLLKTLTKEQLDTLDGFARLRMMNIKKDIRLLMPEITDRDTRKLMSEYVGAKVSWGRKLIAQQKGKQ